MKFLNYVLVICFSMNAFASPMSSHKESLGKLVDEYQYFLTVDWDQKDQAALAKKAEAFSKEMSLLLEKNEVSSQELLSLLGERSGNKEVFERIKLKLALLGSEVKESDIANIMNDVRKEMYSQGAHWLGDIDSSSITFILIIAGTVLLGYVASRAGRYDDSSLGKYVCTEYGQELRCHDDPYSYYDNATVCKWESVCVKGHYEKK